MSTKLSTKKCTKCMLAKPANSDNFAPDKRNRDGLQGQCRECQRKSNKAKTPAQRKHRNAECRKWYKANRTHALAYARSRNIAQYGLTDAQYAELFEHQHGVCAICHQPETFKVKGTVRKLVVDHDHATGAVRGLLCNACNRGLGNFRDDPELLIAAADYLRHPAAPALAAEPLIDSAFAAPVAAASVVP
jgi:cytochrome c551/c552